VQYVDAVPWVWAEKCEPVISDIVVYYNPYHFTKKYADHLSGAVADALKPAMTWEVCDDVQRPGLAEIGQV
jgi:hypothetical protein